MSTPVFGCKNRPRCRLERALLSLVIWLKNTQFYGNPYRIFQLRCRRIQISRSRARSTKSRFRARRRPPSRRRRQSRRLGVRRRRLPTRRRCRSCRICRPCSRICRGRLRRYTTTWLFIRPQGGSEAGWLPNFRGSFSAVWTATIARKDAFCRDFRDLQDLHSFAPL